LEFDQRPLESGVRGEPFQLRIPRAEIVGAELIAPQLRRGLAGYLSLDPARITAIRSRVVIRTGPEEYVFICRAGKAIVAKLQEEFAGAG
jgi:hypothetical protein